MIRHLRHTDIDTAEWDDRLLACMNKLWYAQSHVLGIASPGWEALMDEENGAIMPLTWRKKLGISYLFQPFGLQQLGVFSRTAITPETASAFIAAVPKRFKLAEIAVNPVMPVPTNAGWTSTEHPDQLLDLSVGIEQVRLNYAKGHDRNLRKGQEGGMHVQPMEPKAFVDLFERTTAKRFGGMDAQGLRSLLPLLQAADERGEADIIGVRGEHGWSAGVAFIHWHGRCILLKSAADEEGRGTNAMFHLVDAGIDRACRHSRLLDFAGSEHPGTARFYEGFGAHRSVYLRLTMNDLPFWLKPFKR
ncbi:MAG: GNAT family N-acetyltransferase [Flavobacteriales bacterium]